jgi:acyl-CoA dehydrogenase
MNFDFSDDVLAMKEEVRRFLRERVSADFVRTHVSSGAPYDERLWSTLGDMGWLGVAIPKNYGGSGIGYEPLCMIAESLGSVLAPVPFSSSIYLAAEALLLYGSEAQKRRWLPGIAEGRIKGALALAEGNGDPSAALKSTYSEEGHISGEKLPVFDGGIADFVIVVAKGKHDHLQLVLLERGSMATRPVNTLDLAVQAVSITFDRVAGELLPGAKQWIDLLHLFDRAAVLFAFEQLGGAQAALDLAVAYAMDRFAFGRPIASLQAVKHQLADVYVAVQIARSNAYRGAWALDHAPQELMTAAAAARLAATEAFESAAAQNIHTHGGMGFTWDSECHLYYRRAKRLSGQLGSSRFWRDRLIDSLASTKAVHGFL